MKENGSTRLIAVSRQYFQHNFLTLTSPCGYHWREIRERSFLARRAEGYLVENSCAVKFQRMQMCLFELRKRQFKGS